MFSELIEEVTDWSVLTESVGRYVAGLSFHSVIVTIMMVFLALGAVDKAQGNKRGYGAAFDKGFEAMGPLAIVMVGVIAAAPVLSMVLRPVIAPVYEMLGSSPSVFATTLLLADAGGYSVRYPGRVDGHEKGGSPGAGMRPERPVPGQPARASAARQGGKRRPAGKRSRPGEGRLTPSFPAFRQENDLQRS